MQGILFGSDADFIRVRQRFYQSPAGKPDVRRPFQTDLLHGPAGKPDVRQPFQADMLHGPADRRTEIDPSFGKVAAGYRVDSCRAKLRARGDSSFSPQLNSK